MNYQQIFNRTHAEIDSNDYGELVYALEAVFKAAGYDDITGQELATSQHNHIVGSIGEMSLTTIARSFIGWIRPERPLPYELERITKGEPPLHLNSMRALQIPALTLFSWEASIDNLLKEGRIRRGTKRYETLIQEVVNRQRESSDGKSDGFRRAAQAAIEERRAEIEKVKAELEVENNKARQAALHFRRTADIVAAFCVVADVPDDTEVSRRLRAQATRIEAGIHAMELAIEERLAGLEAYEIEEIVRWSIDRYPDLKAIWEAMNK